MTIDTTVAARTGYDDLREPRFAQQALRKSLETPGRQRQQEFDGFGAVVLGRSTSALCNLLGDRLSGLSFGAPLLLEDLDPAQEYLMRLLVAEGGGAPRSVRLHTPRFDESRSPSRTR